VGIPVWRVVALSSATIWPPESRVLYCCTVTAVLNLSINQIWLTVPLSLIEMCIRTKVHVASLLTTLNQPTFWPHSNLFTHSSRAVSRPSVLNSKAHKDAAMPEANPKSHQAQKISQTISHAWSSSKGLNHVWSSSKSIFPLLIISFLQHPHPATSHPVELTHQSGMPHPSDNFNLDHKHYPLAAICHISGFCSQGLWQSVFPDPSAVIGTMSCVHLWHAGCFPQRPHVFGLLVTKV